jgi:type VI secretion system protein ImpA
MLAELEDSDVLPPISADSPCGPDLDIDGDIEFLNFMAATEGQLPSSYLAFDRNSIDFPTVTAAGRKFLERTLDVRLLALLAKLSILDRDLISFSSWLNATAHLISDHWDEAHPRGEGGEFLARLAQLATFNDGPVVALPLQNIPLAETQRDGVLTFRAQLITLGEVTPRENEIFPDAGAIDKILLNCDLADLRRTLAALQKSAAALTQIRKITREKVGAGDAVSYEVVEPLIERMIAFVRAAVARRDPSVAPPLAPAAASEEGAAAASSASEFASLAEVDAALASALEYFIVSEPSSAAVLLIGQARQLLGKNLYEVMQIVAPSYADSARIFVGAEPAFTVPVRNIAASAAATEAEPQPAVQAAASRAAALSLVEAAANHLRKVEPSNPAPFLLDRARTLASRDFLGLLRELLPEDTLSQMRYSG